MIDPKTLKNTLTMLCGKHELAYNINELPVKVGPDCYMFYASSLSYECRKLGYCKEETYYALTGGDKIVILDSDKNRVK